MNDILLMQVAMEATAMPPPASSASSSNTEQTGDALFDKELEKALNAQPDAETLALATEAVVVPAQTPVTQPRFDGEDVQAAEADVKGLAQKVYALIEGQAQQIQPELASIISADPAAGENPEANQATQAVLPEAPTTKDTTTPEPVLETPVLVEAANPQFATKVAQSQGKKGASAPTTDAQPLETALPSQVSSSGEQTTEPVATDLLGVLKTNSGAKGQPLIEVAGGKNNPIQADTPNTSTQSNASGKSVTDVDNAEIRIDLAKVASSAKQSSQAGNTQAATDTAETTQPPTVDDTAVTMQVPVSESRKVKANLGKIEGESPPQVSTGNRAVQTQELDAQVKEPARLAEARTPEMINQITKGIDLLSRADGQSIRIQLQPENLGKIEIRLTSRADGVTVTLNADTAMTGNLLERNLAELRTSLADAGVNLTSLSVNSGQKQATYQESKQWFSGKDSRNTYSNQTNTIEDLPSVETAWKDSAIDYRV